MKKRKLFFMFLRRWIISLAIVFAIIQGVFVLIYEVFSSNVSAFLYTNIVRDALLKEYVKCIDEGYEGEELYSHLQDASKVIVTRLGMSSYVKIYDFNKNKNLFESQNLAIISIEDGDKTIYYFCDRYESFRELMNNYKDKIKYDDFYATSLYLTVKDIYVKGNEFLPGVIGVNDFNNDGDLVEKESFDLTDVNAIEGYQHIVLDSANTTLLVNSIEDCADIKELRKWVQNQDYYENVDDTFAYFVSGYMNNMYGVGISDIKTEKLNLEIKLCTRVLNEYELNAWRIGCITAFVVVTIFSFLTAYIKYSKLKQIYEMNEYKKTMTLAMAHELKTPLMAISGYAESMKEVKSEEKREEYTESISENVSLMNQIIVNILELSKLEKVKKTSKKDIIDVSDMIDKELQKYHYLLERKNLKIKKSGTFTMTGDAAMFSLAVANMLNNAIKYSRENTDIEIILDSTGIIIRNEYKQYKDKQGTGVGLEVVKAVAGIHGMKYEAKEIGEADSDKEKNKRSFEASLTIK